MAPIHVSFIMNWVSHITPIYTVQIRIAVYIKPIPDFRIVDVVTSSLPLV